MPDLDDQNPFTPPRANVDDVAPPARLVLAQRGARLVAYVLDSAPALVGGAIIACEMWTTMPYTFGRRAGFAPLIQADMTTDADMSKAVAISLWVVGVLCIAWFVYNLVLVYQQGQTWGKRRMGLRMVRLDGSRMSFARFFWLRGVVAGLCCLIPLIGWPIRLIDKLLIFRSSRQCLHDTIADTIVVTAASSTRATLSGAKDA